VHAAGKRIGDVGARALAALLEKNTTLTTLYLGCAQLCARGGWGGGGTEDEDGKHQVQGHRQAVEGFRNQLGQ
jgi:hypothetical protein